MEQIAVVKTWNNADAQWGPMTLAEAVAFAADGMKMGGHRYVEVKGVIVLDTDEVADDAAEAVRKAKEATV